LKVHLSFLKSQALIISIITALLASRTISVYAANPAITSIDRPFSDNLQHGAYYVQGIGLGIQVKASNNPTYVNSNWAGNWKCDLSKTSTVNGISTWNGSWVPTLSDFNPGTFPGLNTAYYNKNTYSMERVGITGYSATAQTLGYVTAVDINTYRAMTPNDTFYYNNELDHDFYAVATGYSTPSSEINGTYNCLGYAIDTCDYWQWPWGGSLPSYTDVINFMNGWDSGPSNNHGIRTWGTIYNNYSFTDSRNAKAIYYSNGHFAKVSTWDSNGYPTSIMSKWGYAELIKSNGYNPFGSEYGNAVIFFNY
jgi:hypothetical protein